jgi:hypothetical protein
MQLPLDLVTFVRAILDCAQLISSHVLPHILVYFVQPRYGSSLFPGT